MKIKIILSFLILSCVLFGQNEKPLESMGKVSLSLAGLDANYELPIGKSFVWSNTLGIGGGYAIQTSNNLDYNFTLNKPVPYFISEMRWMYNRERRFKKGKSNTNNSGGFLAFQTKYSFGSNDIKHHKFILNELHWGFVTPMGPRFVFQFHLGLGFYHDYKTELNMTYPTVGAKFSYILFKN